MAADLSGLEEILDRRLNKQSEHINNLFIKFTKSTKDDLEEVKKSQNFINTKFEELITSVATDNKALRTESSQLRARVALLERLVADSESDTGSIKQYLRRDLIEIHGVPVNRGEDTNLFIYLISLYWTYKCKEKPQEKHTQNNKQYSTTDIRYIHRDKVLRQMAGTPQQ